MTLPRLVKSSTASTDVKRIVCLTWRGLVQHLSLLQTDGEAEVLGCIREAVDDVLSDEFLNGFCASEERQKVVQTAICSETDEDAVQQVLFAAPHEGEC